MQCYIITVNASSLRPYHTTLDLAAGLTCSEILAPPLRLGGWPGGTEGGPLMCCTRGAAYLSHENRL